MRKRMAAAAAVLVLAVGLIASTGCAKGMIRADAIDGLVQDVCAVHDELVRQDEAMTETEKADALRTSEILLKVVETAKQEGEKKEEAEPGGSGGSGP